MPHQVYRNAKGEKLPSVTQILSIISKPQLIHWANQLGFKNIKVSSELKRTARIGTLVHAILEFATSKTPINWSEYSKEEILKACKCSKRFFEFVSYQFEFKPILSEGVFVSEKYQYAGCCDLICHLNNKIVLMDYKTSSAIYNEMISQVAAYKQLAEENGYTIEQCIIFRIGREESEGYEYKELTNKQLKQGFKVFKSALKLYKDIKEFEKIKE